MLIPSRSESSLRTKRPKTHPPTRSVCWVLKQHSKMWTNSNVQCGNAITISKEIPSETSDSERIYLCSQSRHTVHPCVCRSLRNSASWNSAHWSAQVWEKQDSGTMTSPPWEVHFIYLTFVDASLHISIERLSDYVYICAKVHLTCVADGTERFSKKDIDSSLWCATTCVCFPGYQQWNSG